MRKVGIVLAVIMGSGFLLIVGGFFTLYVGTQLTRVSPSTTARDYPQPIYASSSTTVTPASYPGNPSPYDPYSTQAGYNSPGSVPVLPPPYQSAPYNGTPQPLQPAYPSRSTPASAAKSQLEQRYVELSRQHATEMNESELTHKVAQLEAKVRIKRAMALLGAVEQEMDFLEEKFETTRLAAEATAIKQPLNELKAQLIEMASLPEQVKQTQEEEAATPATDSKPVWNTSPANKDRPREPSYPSTEYRPAPGNVLLTPVVAPQPLDAPSPVNALPPAFPSPVPATSPKKKSSGRVLMVTPGANFIGEEEPLLGLDDGAEAEPETKPTKEAKPVTAAKTKRETISIITVTPRIIIQEEEEENLSLTSE